MQNILKQARGGGKEIVIERMIMIKIYYMHV
jgi:hypothetical protein